MASLNEAYGPLYHGNQKPLFSGKIKFDDIIIDTDKKIDSYPSSYFCNGKAYSVEEVQKKLSKLGFDINGGSKKLSTEQSNFLYHIKVEIEEADKFEYEVILPESK